MREGVLAGIGYSNRPHTGEAASAESGWLASKEGDSRNRIALTSSVLRPMRCLFVDRTANKMVPLSTSNRGKTIRLILQTKWGKSLKKF